MKEAQDSYQKSLDIYLRLYGGSHGCVALALLCLARLPDIHRTTLDALALYDRVLKVIDPANRPVQEILKEMGVKVGDVEQANMLLKSVIKLQRVYRLRLYVYEHFGFASQSPYPAGTAQPSPVPTPPPSPPISAQSAIPSLLSLSPTRPSPAQGGDVLRQSGQFEPRPHRLP